VRDIALAQQAEQRLRENEERFQSLSACSPVGIFLTDVEGRCTYTNPRCQAICGFTLEKAWEWVGRSRFIQKIGREYLQIGQKVLVKVANTPTSFASKPRKEQFAGFTSAHRLCSRTRAKLIGHVGTVEDITERKQLEGKLGCSEQELSDFVNNAPMGLHCVGADGYILWANQSELELLGYSEEEYIGHHITKSTLTKM
jgi:PAS domain-containing protein